ncbi:hypothetical protein Ahy_B05g074862 [Arachis hypogaea]|uniref:SWIM-type domain-containing protein n=1 Tax=Arachis hypogaea TaxID=3818 RepID=A0A444YZY9_ARAHY|nr:hypothetical protein Ahy_B05g074862 [Arachis hypogaea]
MVHMKSNTRCFTTNCKKELDQGGNWMAIYAGRDKYEVYNTHGNRKKFVLDLSKRECSCRKYQLAGIPCQHAMSCIMKMCFDVDSYFDDCFKKDTYVRCYEHIIYPVNGSNLWERTLHDDVLPPVFRKSIGRPKKE